MSTIKENTQAGCETQPAEVKIWDIAVRVFHWSLVITYALAWVSADEWDRFHEITGYIIAGLLGFRIIWGFIGTRHARFTDFICKPSTVIQYLTDSLAGRAKRYLGHNPVGGAMVIALILSLAGVIASGIAITSDMFWGVEWVEEVHEVMANATLVLIVLHVVGVIYAGYEHKENLIRAMITGLKRSS